MTCIVGIVDNGTVWIGADSAGVDGWNMTIVKAPKVFQAGPYLIGYTSSFRMGQLLQYGLTVPEQDPDHTDERHMMTTFVDAVRQCFKDGGFAKIESSREEGGSFLVGYGGQLYGVEDSFQVITYADGFAAVGSGNVAALGAMFALRDARPAERVRIALQAAEAFNIGVRAPFIIKELSS